MISNYNYILSYTFGFLAPFILCLPNHHPSHVFLPYHPTETDFCQNLPIRQSLKNDFRVTKSNGEFLITRLVWHTRRLIQLVTSLFYNTISNYCLLYISIFIFLLYHCAWFQTTLHFSFHILFGLGMPQHSVLFNHIHSLSVIICCLTVSNSIWRQNSQTYTYT